MSGTVLGTRERLPGKVSLPLGGPQPGCPLLSRGSRETSEKSGSDAETGTIGWPGEQIKSMSGERNWVCQSPRLERARHAGGTERTHHYSDRQGAIPRRSPNWFFMVISVSFITVT